VSERLPEPVYEPMRPPPQPRPPKPAWRKAGRILCIALLSVLGFVVLAVVVALVWLHTGKGGEELGRFVAHEARLAIAGDLRVRDIRTGGFLHLCVEGVELRDPQGHKVMAADRICVKLNPLALKAHRVKISEALIENPWVEIATVPDKTPGLHTTTLARALAPRKAQEKPSATSVPFDWVIEVAALQLRGGTLAMRPLGEPATFALEDLDISQAHARYSIEGTTAALKLAAMLAAPGRAPVALDLDATLEGAPASGNATVRALRLRLGESTLDLDGRWDLARQAGELHMRNFSVRSKDVEAIAPRAPVEGQIAGEADLRSDGKTAQLDLRVQAGGGRIDAKATATLEKKPEWDLQLGIDKVDPGAANALAPRGEVTARASLHGKGMPQIDEHGVLGDFRAVVHVGPARLERVGPVVADLDARVEGRHALIKAFSASALDLKIKAHGVATRDEISLDLDVDAPSLEEAGRMIGALTRKPSLPLSGSLQLSAHVTGSPARPDARVRLRAPHLRWGPTLAADGLSVQGTLVGPLTEPDGSLQISGQRLVAAGVDLGAPRIDMGLEWPIAHVRIDAGVRGGALQLAGDARIDDDKDGLVLSHFIVAYPGNTLHLAHDTDIHFRNEVIVEPLELVGDHGGLRLSAELWPETARQPARIDAAVVLTRFELDHLPLFALAKDFGLHGVVDANAVVQGPQKEPDVDVRADIHGAGAGPAGDLNLDGHTHAHLNASRLKTDGWIAAPGLLRLSFNGEVPALQLAQQPQGAPVQFEAQLDQVDLATLAATAKIAPAQHQRLRGLVRAHLVATGTLGQPRATFSLEAHGLGTEIIKQVDARAGLLLEKGELTLDGDVSLQGSPALGFTALAPFDLLRALREPGYLRGALERAVKADVAVTRLELKRLAEAGFLPQGSEGAVSLSLRLGGTPSQPTLSMSTAGESITVGRLHGLGFQGEMDIASSVKLSFGATAQQDVVAQLDAKAALSGGELLELIQRRDDPAIAPLLGRAVSLTLDIPGLAIARASQWAMQKSVAEGRLTGHVALSGTPARPRLTGTLEIKDVASESRKMGKADLYVDGDQSGALLHVGIDPPGGGSFLGHVRLEADLGARAFLRRGAMALLDGQLSGDVQAKRLDLAFLSGLAPNLRRTGGKLDGALKVSGLLGKPLAEGDAHLRSGLFDVVGQGVFDDVGLDAKFSPKEVVIDRLTGSTGDGTFSAIVVASRRPAAAGDAPDRVEYTGEVHLGDSESVRDRKRPDGKPLRAGPVPVRQAGEQRADVSGELDLFGDYADSLLTLNAKIPDARMQIRQLSSKKLPGLGPHPEVVLIHPGERPHPPGVEPEEAAAAERARQQASFRMRAHLEVVHLYVKAEDFEFPVESNLNFDYDARHPDKPTADGVVHVPSGSFTALGRRFTIVDAKITETGADLEDPELDIKARFSNPQATVIITVAGTAKAPEVDMSSVPSMDQDAIAFFLATGRVQGRATQMGGGVDLSGAASSVLGSILFGQVRKDLADVLPVDVLTIETGSTGAAEATVGKYIGDRIYIGYRQRLTPAPAENTTEGHIEYEINRSLAAEATIGDKTRDLSFLFTKDF
jgi:autotransporter translocation and assembly factor TamB